MDRNTLRELLIQAAAMAVASERKGSYKGAAWVADAVMPAGYVATATAAQPDELRRAVRRMADVLESGEWAEHVSADPDAAELEAAITDLHSEHSAMHDALTGAGWTLTDGEWIAPAAATAAQPQPLDYPELRAEREALLDALAACRDACGAPPHGDPLELAWVQAMADPGAVPEYVKAKLAAATAAQPSPLQPVDGAADIHRWAKRAIELIGPAHPDESEERQVALEKAVDHLMWIANRAKPADGPAAGATGEQQS